MLNGFLPLHAGNEYHGHKLALWIFAVVVLFRLGMSLNSFLNPRTTVRYADGIPIHTYPPAAAEATVSLFSLVGLYSFIICLMCIVVFIWYRNLVPVMFTLLLMQSIGGKLVPHFLPIARTGTPPGIYVNWILLALMVIGLALSIPWRAGNA
jgi:hypothetical protein